MIDIACEAAKNRDDLAHVAIIAVAILLLWIWDK